MSSKCRFLLIISGVLLSICHLGESSPGFRDRRDDVKDLVSIENYNNDDLNPINTENLLYNGLERNKRKLPDATFEAKNAVLGFVFGKIDNFLDTKTHVIEQLDRSNIEKNKQWDIKSPVPIKDFQTLITAVVSPKIRTIGNIANDLTTGVLTTITALSGSSTGSGNIVSKLLSFSGPILQGSSGGTQGISGVTTPSPDSDEAGY